MQNQISESFFNYFIYQQQSDIVRLYLLCEYGGIWIDMTTIFSTNLNWVIDKYNYGYDQVGF